MDTITITIDNPNNIVIDSFCKKYKYLKEIVDVSKPAETKGELTYIVNPVTEKEFTKSVINGFISGIIQDAQTEIKAETAETEIKQSIENIKIEIK